jgi:hypothetical protein
MNSEHIISKEDQSGKMNMYMLYPPINQTQCTSTRIAGLHCKSTNPDTIRINIETNLWKGEQSKAVDNMTRTVNQQIQPTSYANMFEYMDLQGESTREHKSCKSESMLLSRLTNYVPHIFENQIQTIPRESLFGEDTRNVSKDSK